MHRQSIIVILIGAIASVSGFATIDYLRGRRCAGLQGIWSASLRECRLDTGETTGTLTVLAVVAGIAIASAVGFTLYRVHLFATGRAQRMASSQGR